ncbi:MAG: F0F1 ATP synthase subunit epsilon [Phreatobacter sp.]|uniref:F0F1 ATP synthase subunit epsilon n=1 Tax=Phreatobacter sp. TaxID=1966341 RepID=UPI001A3E2F10|nr:F0F1 ATP synthase subunit epsilon [Phreatobacter sp.]MBL8570499.1 F0F1 ATP synthase subunit epsilon [Phreatobacter sp.]
MATFNFELVSPERQLFSGAVEQVVVPGADGDFGVLAGHAPFVASLRPGILTIHADGQPKRLYVRGGFAEVSDGSLAVLAERATPVEDLHADQIDAEIKDAQDDIADAKDDATRGKAAERLGQLQSLKGALGTIGATH